MNNKEQYKQLKVILCCVCLLQGKRGENTEQSGGGEGGTCNSRYRATHTLMHRTAGIFLNVFFNGRLKLAHSASRFWTHSLISRSFCVKDSIGFL